MSAELEGTGAEVELIGGGGGIFDVEIDGTLVFSRFESNRFPQPGEIVRFLTQG